MIRSNCTREMIVAGAMIAVLGPLVVPAAAADLPLKARMAQTVFDWTGLYVGAHAGYTRDHARATLTDPSGMVSAGAACEVRISCEPTFAALWLVPNLERVRAAHGQVSVVIESDPRLIEFRASRVDLAIRFSAQATSWPRSQARRLVDTSMVAVVSPVLAEGPVPIRQPADLLAHTLIHDENRDIWVRWLAAAGVAAPDDDRGPVYADGSLVLQAVLRGHGVGLIDSIFAPDEISDGRIVVPFDVDFPCGAYFLVARDFARLTPAANLFANWISAAFSAERPA